LKANAIFRIASMTKALTTSAFMVLAKEKELDLHTPAENYIDDLKSLKVASLENSEIIYSEPETKVTLHQLLTHTSGFGYDFHHETLSHLLLDEKIVGLLDKEGKFLEAPLIEQPGKYWHYGIGLGWIGRIIETLSEQSLNDYMTEKLFKPLEMNNTFL
jgi:methyl acetate hydrolase